jgi:hypothetical protein
MNFCRRFLGGAIGACVLPVALAAGCGGDDSVATDTEAVSTSDEAIIAGVDAKSASLNAVGSLVLVSRYTYCPYPYDCGYGGTTGYGGTPVVAGATMITKRAAIPAIPSDPFSGRLDRIGQSLASAGSAGTTVVGGGATGKGGAPSRGGAPNVGGTTGTAGSGVGGTTIQPIEVVEYDPFCSGTLVGPTAVMTAEHCLQDLEYYYSVEVAFAVGPDARNPIAVYPIVDWDWEAAVPADYNNLLGDLGSDVGVAHLGVPVANIAPLAIGSLSAADIGKRFTALGFGIQNNYETNGTRKAGSVTYRGSGGNYADYAFGGLAGFLKVAPTMPAFAGLPVEYLTELYYQLNLIPDYQGFFGGRCGDAQPCYGDSGGPIIAVRNGMRTVFGNITNGFGSSRLICDYGVVAAIFGPLTLTYLEESLQWVDPCEGVTVKGYCDGDLAIRCTDRLEGERRLSETDCGLIDQTCGLDETGTVACVDRAF